MTFHHAAAVFAAAFSASAVSAEPVALADAVPEAVFETCPAILAGDLSVGDPEAVRRAGFEIIPGEAGKVADPRVGELTLITRSATDGMLGIAAAGENALCQVQFEGETGALVMEDVRAQLLSPEEGYVADPSNSGSRGAMSMQSYKKLLEPGVVAFFQLITAAHPGPHPRMIVQIVIQEE